MDQLPGQMEVIGVRCFFPIVYVVLITRYFISCNEIGLLRSVLALLIDWLIGVDRVFGRLIVWSIECSIDWLIERSIDWLIGFNRFFGRLIVWFIEYSIDWLIERSIDWLIGFDRFFGRLIVWFIEYSIDWLIERSIDWLIDWSQANRRRDRETGLRNVQYDLVGEHRLTIGETPVTVLNVKLHCDTRKTSWCEFPNPPRASPSTAPAH